MSDTGNHEVHGSAAGAGTEFSAGQDVRLISEHARVAERENLAVAGTVTGVERQEDETFGYTVHFPGDAGVQRGLAADDLEATESPAVKLRGGGGALTIKEADERLTMFDEASRPGASTGAGRLDILCSLAAACRMETRDLAKQLLPKIAQRERELDREKRSNPAALAANDNPRPFEGPAVSAEFAWPGHQPAPPAQQSRRGGPRP